MQSQGFTALLGAFLLVLPAAAQQKAPRFPYQDPKAPVEVRIRDLLGRMTLEEKVAQLRCKWINSEKDVPGPEGAGVTRIRINHLPPLEGARKVNQILELFLQRSRLGVPPINHNESLHGLLARGSTSFPQAIGLAATFDPVLMEKIGTVIGKEARARGVRQVLSPVVNIARDVRWGRTQETYGEDPYLTSRMGAAYCRGVGKSGVITTPKHFVANIGDGGRDSNAVHFSSLLLHEIYFPGFRACIREGGALSIMAAYNSLDGRPCSADHWLLTEILRNEIGFRGYVVSDYGSVAGIMEKHHTAATRLEAAVQAVEGGLDVELPDVKYFGKPLLEAARKGILPGDTLDLAVSRVLRAKFEMGIFDKPFADLKAVAWLTDCPAHQALALEAGRKAITLLKNRKGTLPLPKTLSSIAVLGPVAAKGRLGNYSRSPQDAVSLLEGIKDILPPQTKVYYAKGCGGENPALPTVPAAYLRPAGGPAGAQGLKGEYFKGKKLSGKPAFLRLDRVIDFDFDQKAPGKPLGTDDFSIRWTGYLLSPGEGDWKLSLTSDDGIRFWLDGKLLVDSWNDRAATTDYVTVHFKKGKTYKIKIEYYENTGFASVKFGWAPLGKPDPLLAEALEAARKADAVVVAAGIDEGEGRDRSKLDLPGDQEKLIQAVAGLGKPVIVVLYAGSAVTMEKWLDKVDAVVDAWYPGEKGGLALAEVLFGDYNPAGRLPITFPRSVGQCPLYYNFKPTGRGYGYVDQSGSPRFPFGYGLSYTTFRYSSLVIEPKKPAMGQTVKVAFKVKNTGKRVGDEVVQLYLRDLVASLSQPLKELKRFKRITLKPGEEKEVVFHLQPADLAFYTRAGRLKVEPGEFQVMVGASSADIKLRGSFTVTGY